jgi:hypothetical protein
VSEPSTIEGMFTSKPVRLSSVVLTLSRANACGHNHVYKCMRRALDLLRCDRKLTVPSNVSRCEPRADARGCGCAYGCAAAVRGARATSRLLDLRESVEQI